MKAVRFSVEGLLVSRGWGCSFPQLPWICLFIIFQSGQEEGGGERSFNPFHLGFNPNILVGMKFSTSLDIVIIIHHHHHPL